MTIVHMSDWKPVKKTSKRREVAPSESSSFNATKGFGFIQPDAGGPDVFVHVSAVERAGLRGLNEGQKIAYEVVADKRTISLCPSPWRAPLE